MADYVSDDCSVSYTTTGALAAGAVVMMGDLIGVANRPIAANGTGTVDIDGIHSMPKGTGEITQGAIVYWNHVDSVITTSANSGGQSPVTYKRAGKASATAVSAATTVRVILNCG
jgi:predicted RecA/RadA family phage recombinase